MSFVVINWKQMHLYEFLCFSEHFRSNTPYDHLIYDHLLYDHLIYDHLINDHLIYDHLSTDQSRSYILGNRGNCLSKICSLGKNLACLGGKSRYFRHNKSTVNSLYRNSSCSIQF